MSESPCVISLGWMLPRSQDAERVAKFYGRVLQLPLLRGYGNAWLFWAGETVVFEPKSDDGPEWRYPEWDSSPTLPVLRCVNLASVLQRLRHFDVEIVEETNEDFASIAVMRDIDGHFVMLREAVADSPKLSDVMARQRANTAWKCTAFNPGVPPMPADIQGIDRVIRHVADVSAMTDFYTDKIGLNVIELAESVVVLDCGDSTTLELRSGGKVERIPDDRFEIPDALILRVNDFDGYKAKLLSNGVHIVNDKIQFGRGALGYFCDPEGHLVGYEERYEQAQCKDGAVAFSEDLEANRRWRAANQ